VITLPNGIDSEGPEYEAGWAYGADCGWLDNLIAICEANHLCNKYGIDPISAGSTIACAMELYEKAICPKRTLTRGLNPFLVALKPLSITPRRLL